MRYNRVDITKTIASALRLASRRNRNQYIYATACGYLIDHAPPYFRQQYMEITPSGIVTTRES